MWIEINTHLTKKSVETHTKNCVSNHEAFRIFWPNVFMMTKVIVFFPLLYFHWQREVRINFLLEWFSMHARHSILFWHLKTFWTSNASINEHYRQMYKCFAMNRSSTMMVVVMMAAAAAAMSMVVVVVTATLFAMWHREKKLNVR